MKLLGLNETKLKNALIFAIARDNYDLIFDILTKSKLNVNFGNKCAKIAAPVDPDGKIPNPLFSAIAHAKSVIVMLLLEHGADKNILSPHGKNALQNNKIALAIYFIRNGVKLNTEKANASDFMHENIVDKDNILAFLAEEEAAVSDSQQTGQVRTNKFMSCEIEKKGEVTQLSSDQKEKFQEILMTFTKETMSIRPETTEKEIESAQKMLMNIVSPLMNMGFFKSSK